MILAIDTSIGTSVALVDDDGSVITERESADPRGHAEAIGTLIAECIAGRDEITAVAVGMGPGPVHGPAGRHRRRPRVREGPGRAGAPGAEPRRGRRAEDRRYGVHGGHRREAS